MQRILTVAIQGDQASFHDIAAHNYYKQPIQLVFCQTFYETFQELVCGRVDRAFVATSNSAHGEISEVADLLQKYDVEREGEHNQLIDQHLIGLPSFMA